MLGSGNARQFESAFVGQSFYAVRCHTFMVGAYCGTCRASSTHILFRVRLTAIVIVAMLAGCRGKRVGFSSDLKMSDALSERQLIAGFHDLEQKQWRWTSRRFAVVLQPPPGAELHGGTLELHLFIPDSQIQKFGPITLNAEAADMSLAPATFIKGGAHSYARKVAPALFRGALLPVVFTYDKALAPSNQENRELAAVVSEISLRAE